MKQKKNKKIYLLDLTEWVIHRKIKNMKRNHVKYRKPIDEIIKFRNKKHDSPTLSLHVCNFKFKYRCT